MRQRRSTARAVSVEILIEKRRLARSRGARSGRQVAGRKRARGAATRLAEGGVMKLLHALRRPRWLVVIGCAAVLAPAAVLVSGVAATDDVVTSQATPLVDRDYIYGQLFDMSYNDVYRVSGADGPPTDPSSPWNQPATVNGWQEFFQHWKDQLTDKTAMSTMAKYATVKDHYFHRLPEQRTNPNYSFNPNYPWDSNDAEITLPGATC